MPPLFPGVAVITGAASGIGRQIAIAFAVEDCRRIAIFDKDEENLTHTAKLVKEINGDSQTFSLPFDARNEHDIRTGFECVVEEWGRIDYAVNCAGIMGPLAPTTELSTEDFDNVTRTNFRGLWLSVREELKYMVRQEPLQTKDGRPGNRGSIVNIASNLALVSRHDAPAYAASKAAVVSLTRSDAIDYSKHNIRVNCVCPGLISTPMTKGISPDDPVVQMAPMGRMGTPQEVADAVIFLISSRASFIQGAALSVDGGYVIN